MRVRRKWLIVAGCFLVVVFAAWELPNYLQKPSLRSFSFSQEKCQVDLYSDHSPTRRVAIFFTSGEHPVLLDLIDGRNQSMTGNSFGSLRWTADRSALVATELVEGGIVSSKPIWIFDVSTQKPVSANQRSIVMLSRGGLGERVFSWYELGKDGHYLFNWQARRWRSQISEILEKAR